MQHVPFNNFALTCGVYKWLWTSNAHRLRDFETRNYSIFRIITVSVPLQPALVYKPLILGPKIEEFPCLVHKLFIILTALQYKLH